MQINIHQNLDSCRELWSYIYRRPANIFELWEVRSIFHRYFKQTPYFITLKNSHNALIGILPLAKDEFSKKIHFFPGELWHDKTWLEGNKVFAENRQALEIMLNEIDNVSHLRYLDSTSLPNNFFDFNEDEIKYLFHPVDYQYSFENYQKSFNGKSLKKIKKELSFLEEAGLTYRWNNLSDIEILIQMNLAAFGENSYFQDERFLGSFIALMDWFQAQNMLHLTTILIGNKVAAIDAGAIYNNQYTVLAGGTSPDFPGIAKVINFYHLGFACDKKFDQVDFLCGDFGWKSRFKLQPNPLHEIWLNKNTEDTLIDSSNINIVEHVL